MIQKIQTANYINPYQNYANVQNPYYNCTSCRLPKGRQNYCTFDKNEVDYFVKQKENALPYLTNILTYSNNEPQITEALYITDRLLENGTRGIDKLYPVFGFDGAIVFVTHDRLFADNCATRIVELDRGKMYSYPGSFNKYLELREERLRKE